MTTRPVPRPPERAAIEPPPASGAAPLVGRRTEIAQIKELLRQARLVTLTGVAGVGKTRLARQVATEVRRAAHIRACVVELAPLRDSTLVAHTIALALGRPVRSADKPLADVIDYLRDRRFLLVVDNCEHLVEACAEVVNTLIQASARLRVLATSRQPLGIAGEQLCPVLPLLSLSETVAGAEGEAPAVSLFAERARTLVPGFSITVDNRDVVAEICRQVDGLPLAIELSAARLATLSLEELLVGLQDHYRILDDPTAVPCADRHGSLAAAIDWSYDLCTPAEQRMWQRLSVFPADFSLDAVEHVAVFGDVGIDVLFALVDKSVVTRADRGGRTRYRLLDTLAWYGRDKLQETGEEPIVRRRHRDWCFAQVTRWAQQWFGPHQVRLVDEIRFEHANLRAALAFSLATPGEAGTALAIAATLWFYWRGCGLFTEGRYWLDRALRASPQRGPERGKALWANGWLAAAQGDKESATSLGEQLLVEAHRFQDGTARARATHLLGATAMMGDDLASARTLLSEASQRFAAEVANQPDDNDLRVIALMNRIHLSVVHGLQGDLEKATAISDECRQLCEQYGEQWARSYALYALALAEWSASKESEAAAHVRQALQLKRSLHDLMGIGLTVELAAWIAATDGSCERAAVLLGAAERLWQRFGQPLFGSRDWIAPHRECETRCGHELGWDGFQAAHRRGAELTTTQAIAYVLSA